MSWIFLECRCVTSQMISRCAKCANAMDTVTRNRVGFTEYISTVFQQNKAK